MNKIAKSEKEIKFEVLIFGSGINAYSLARSFNEAYGMAVTCYGTDSDNPCAFSNFIDYKENAEILDPYTFYNLVKDFSDGKGHEVLVFACDKEFLTLLVRLKNDFPPNVIVPYISEELFSELSNPARLSKAFENVDLRLPKCFVYSYDMDYNVDIPFDAPYKLEYDGKTVLIQDREELTQHFADTLNSGYDEDIKITEEFDDNANYYSFCCYLDREAKLKLQLFFEASSNDKTSFLTTTNGDIMRQCKDFLEENNVSGFVTIDLKYSKTANEYVIFNISFMQDPLFFALQLLDISIAKLVVSDAIDKADLESFVMMDEIIWSIENKNNNIFKNAKESLSEKIKEIVKADKVYNPLVNKNESKRFQMKRGSFSNVQR